MENNQPEVDVMVAAGGGGGCSWRPVRVLKKEKWKTINRRWMW